MENQDKIFEQFKNAAEKAEIKDFPEMEKIWSRVDAKLDTVVYKKQNNNWKKLAVAASVVLVGIIVFQFTKTENKVMIPENEVVVSDAKKEVLPESITEENAIVSTEENNNIIKTDAEKILKKQIETQASVAVLDEKDAEPAMAKELDEAVSVSDDYVKSASNVASANNSGYVLRGRVFDAIGVHHTTQESEKKDSKKAEAQDSKNAPLVVIDGKPIINGKKSGEAIVSELDNEAFDTVYLKEPLYIINGTYYSEESLFGKNPTSPYAPLDKQEIKTIKILQDENTTAVYGEKGKKGVVIITTKTGKPIEPK
ncbi:MAG: hypothetical protein ABI549_00225 [Flavobacterium sp.]|uniref:hypothetical protein n=1 Tax=Flavobacterium sp. TaxID=239 RepID=UPI0032635C49